MEGEQEPSAWPSSDAAFYSHFFWFRSVMSGASETLSFWNHFVAFWNPFVASWTLFLSFACFSLGLVDG